MIRSLRLALLLLGCASSAAEPTGTTGPTCVAVEAACDLDDPNSHCCDADAVCVADPIAKGGLCGKPCSLTCPINSPTGCCRALPKDQTMWCADGARAEAGTCEPPPSDLHRWCMSVTWCQPPYSGQ